MKILLLLFLLSMIVTGCADMYEDITVHDDGSFTIKRMLVMESPLGGLMNGLSDAMSDSTSPSTSNPSSSKQKLDSTAQKFIVPRKAFAKLKGILSYRAIDSTNDSTIIAGVEIHLKDTTSLAAVHEILWRSTDSLKSTSSKDMPSMLPDSNAKLPDFVLGVSRVGNKTTITYSMPPVNASTMQLPPQFSKKILRGMLAMFGVYVRVFSDHLLPATDFCQIETKPGYQQWRVPLENVFDPDYATHNSMLFVVQLTH
jgi:hypothetical protein